MVHQTGPFFFTKRALLVPGFQLSNITWYVYIHIYIHIFAGIDIDIDLDIIDIDI